VKVPLPADYSKADECEDCCAQPAVYGLAAVVPLKPRWCTGCKDPHGEVVFIERRVGANGSRGTSLSTAKGCAGAW
jgi:hypothetical protein